MFDFFDVQNKCLADLRSAVKLFKSINSGSLVFSGKAWRATLNFKIRVKRLKSNCGGNNFLNRLGIRI